MEGASDHIWVVVVIHPGIDLHPPQSNHRSNHRRKQSALLEVRVEDESLEKTGQR